MNLPIAILPTALAALIVSCSDNHSAAANTDDSAMPDEAIASIGSKYWLLKSDLAYYKESTGSRSAEVSLDTLIDEQVLAANAKEEGLAEMPQVRAAIRRLLASAYLEQFATETPVVTNDEVEAAWNASGDRFVVPASARIAVLRQKLDGTETQAALEKLAKAREAFLSLPESVSRRGFGTLAVDFSDDPNTRFQGGDYGKVVAGQAHVCLPLEVVATACATQNVGLVNEPIVAAGAAWLVLVSEQAPAARRPLVEVAPQLRHELEADAAARQHSELLSAARGKQPAKILIDIKSMKFHTEPATNESPPLFTDR
ncbi:MAG: hypothetical protein KDN22_08000 [Verrucomicrobiae bacterium]|nr:hypothetical protein [Verrucomicrobiae bacterium]